VQGDDGVQVGVGYLAEGGLDVVTSRNDPSSITSVVVSSLVNPPRASMWNA
jgi:hypothetical protein